MHKSHAFLGYTFYVGDARITEEDERDKTLVIHTIGDKEDQIPYPTRSIHVCSLLFNFAQLLYKHLLQMRLQHKINICFSLEMERMNTCL